MADTTKKIDLVRTIGSNTEHKEGYVGFCKLAFALGFIAPLSRKDWLNAVIMFFTPIMVFITLVYMCDGIANLLHWIFGFDLHELISDDVFFPIILILSFLDSVVK